MRFHVCIDSLVVACAEQSAAVLTLCACTPPLEEVLKLWDFLLAYGVHLNVLCVIAQLILMREDVIEAKR